MGEVEVAIRWNTNSVIELFLFFANDIFAEEGGMRSEGLRLALAR